MDQRKQLIRNVQHTAQLVVSDFDQYCAYLKTAENLYKYPARSSLFIHSQLPTATYVADYDTWKKIGRSVNYGTRALAVLESKGKQTSLFDVSQTFGIPRAFPNFHLLKGEFAQVSVQMTDSVQEDTSDEQLLYHLVMNTPTMDSQQHLRDSSLFERYTAFYILANKLAIPVSDAHLQELRQHYKNSLTGEVGQLPLYVENALRIVRGKLVELKPVIERVHSRDYQWIDTKKAIVEVQPVAPLLEPVEEQTRVHEEIQASETILEGKGSDLVITETNTVKEINLFDSVIDEPVKPSVVVENSSTMGSQSGYRFPADTIYSKFKFQKQKDNIRAVQLMKELQSAQAQATTSEQAILAKYVGWGGLSELFDDRTDAFKHDREALQALVTDKEYLAMRDSVLTAYYTDPMIIRAMYEQLERMGFRGGKILDPAMGTGNFFSALPDSIRKQSELFGVELDPITAGIAEQLHPDAHIQTKGFEETTFSEKSFDLVVGNIPFNNFQIADATLDKKYVVHDYFIKKATQLVKDGGIIAFITSSFTLDKQNPAFRQELFENQVDFLGAVRLPNNAFKAIAGTDVVTDIVFFQKNVEQKERSDRWLFAGQTEQTESIRFNEYFIENPQQVLGELVIKNYHGQTLSVKEVTPLAELLPKQLAAMTSEKLSHTKRAEVDESADLELTQMLLDYTESSPESLEPTFVEQSLSPTIELDIQTIPLYTYTEHDGKMYFRSVNGVEEQALNKRSFERIQGMILIRDNLKELIALQQVENFSLTDFEQLLTRLNENYDRFVLKNGYLNDSANSNVFLGDDSSPLLTSTERKNEDGSFSKEAIYFQPTINPVKEIKAVTSAQEALLISMALKNNVDFEYIQSIYAHSKEEIIAELGMEIFKNPLTGDYESKDVYLTGDVKSKLGIAKGYAMTNPEEFNKNVEALLEIQPAPLEAKDIIVKVGATWVPKDIYQDFINEVFERSAYSIYYDNQKLEYNDVKGIWFIQGKSSGNRGSVTTTKYGTSRVNALKLFEDALNLKKSMVYDTVIEVIDGEEKKVQKVNSSETILARSKQDQILAKFDSWLFSDNERSTRLIKIYNDRFNRFRVRQYDGKNMILNGLNKQFDLRPHQKNVVARIANEGRALMGHVVGAGKTLSMISAGMLMKEQGTINKPLYVVPNHLINEFAQDVMRFFPSKKVLITTKKDFEKMNRKKFVGRIATGDYDAIVIGHSQFEKIPLSRERQIANIEQELQTISANVQREKDKNGDSWSFKQLLLFEKNLKQKLEEMNKDQGKDQHITFEETGVDFLFVDEAHVYKNLYTYTKLSNVAGVNSSHSKRASDMLMKCRYIQEKNDGKGVVFATGTPISNSMSELFTMQRYLQPDILEQLQVGHFDSWASTFGEIVSSLEIKPEGSGYQMKTRFSKFHNLPELMTAFSLVADIQTADMLNLPVPEIETGKPQIKVSEPTKRQQEMMAEFDNRAEAIRNNLVDPSEDNMLKLTHEAKLMAIDMRLVDPFALAEEQSKINMSCENIYKIWKESEDTLGTQLIFSDSGTPKKDKFNVYDEIKQVLHEKGVPDEQIAFIHDAKTDAQKKELFAKMRAGTIRILLGSTSKLGTGTNVQDKIVALHHIDCPWRPSDLIQRDGRGIRQGNENKSVGIFVYVTKGTFDSYLWQIQEQKLTYINQVMSGKSISRSCSDIDNTVLSAAEVKAIATNNPLLAEKMSIDNEVVRLQLLKAEWKNDHIKNYKLVHETYPQEISSSKSLLKKLESDLESLQSSDEFQIQVNGLSFTERQEAGEVLQDLLSGKQLLSTSKIEVGQYRGFTLTVAPSSMGGYVMLAEKQGAYQIDLNTSNPLGMIRRIENVSLRVGKQVLEEQERLEFAEKELLTLDKLTDLPFEYDDRLEALLGRQSVINNSIELGESVEREEELESPNKSSEPSDTLVIERRPTDAIKRSIAPNLER